MIQKILYKTSFTRTLFFFIGDVFLISLSIFSAFLLRFEGVVPKAYFENESIIWFIILTVSVLSPLFFMFKMYSLSWSYVSTRELLTLWKAVTIGFLIITGLIVVFRYIPAFTIFPRSILIMSYVLIFVSTGLLRLSKRIYKQSAPRNSIKENIRVLIVGAGDAGEQLVRNMKDARGKYEPVAFVDDANSKQGMNIHGVKVVGRVVDIPKIVSNEDIEEIIIAMPSVAPNVIKKAVRLGRESGIRNIRVVPSLAEIIHGKISLADIREVEVSDLLSRDTISLDTDSIKKFIEQKTVLVTGAAGSIGAELVRQISQFNPSKLILLDQDESGIFYISEELKDKFPSLKFVSIVADITNEKKIQRIFEKFTPQIVFHAAAYKHVPLMEDNSGEAVLNNIFGTKIVAQSAMSFGVEHFIFISTDKAVKPSSIMGATKRVGEMLCRLYNQKGNTRFISVRFGNVLDSRGNVVSVFKKQIERGGPVKVTHPDMKRYFMTTPEACLLVMQAGAMGEAGEVFVLDMGDPVKIVDLAREMIRLSGYEPDKDVPIVFTEPRPGEKMFEELLTAEEGTVATKNQKIFVAKLSEVNEEVLESVLSQLHGALNKDEIYLILKKAVPSYVNN